MRLVAEAVVLAGRERVETLKPGAVGPHAEDRATVRVAAHGSAAVEEPPEAISDPRGHAPSVPPKACRTRRVELVRSPAGQLARSASATPAVVRAKNFARRWRGRRSPDMS